MIESLIIPRPFDLDVFLSALAEQRGKHIRLIPAGSGVGQPYGMLISTAEVDYIYWSSSMPPLQAQHTVMHEVGHLLFGHDSIGPNRGEIPRVAGADALAVLLPNLSSALVERILGRTVYAAEEEREAELFASLVLTRAGCSREASHGAEPDTPPPWRSFLRWRP